MGFSLAETTGRFWLIGTLALFAITLVLAFATMKRCHGRDHHRRHMRATHIHKFDHYKPVRKCVDGRWVIAHGHQLPTR